MSDRLSGHLPVLFVLLVARASCGLTRPRIGL